MFKRLFGRNDAASPPQPPSGDQDALPHDGPVPDYLAPAVRDAGDTEPLNPPSGADVGDRGGAGSAGDAPGDPPDPLSLHEGTATGTDVDVPPPMPDPSAIADAPAEAPSGVDEPTAEAGILDDRFPPVAIGASAEPAPAPLVAGALIDGRYLVVGSLNAAGAAQLLGEGADLTADELYAADDRRGYERCWSCGSTSNTEQQRFCVDCGAALQHHRVVLARTAQPTGDPDEFVEEGSWYHLVHPRKQFGADGITLEVGGFSAEGPHHPNEDSYWCAIAGGCYDSASEVFGVFVLADGMGGYAPGSGLISKEIVRSVGRGIFSILYEEPNTAVQEADLQAIVRGAIAQANDTVLEQIAQHGEMGATLVTAVVYGQTVYVANIGDSRAYYASPGGVLTQITRDQSLIEQQVAAGLLDPDAVYTAIGNNVILHAIGEERVEEASDWYSHPLEPGGRILLCSDGYWKTMAHHVWDPELAAPQPTLRLLARAMVDQALAHDSDDNTTVVVIGID